MISTEPSQVRKKFFLGFGRDEAPGDYHIHLEALC